jgi:protein TonB
MKLLVALFIITFFSTTGYSQNSDTLNGLPGITHGAGLDTNNAKKVYTVVQIPAQFPGGLPAWQMYLEKNLDVTLGERYIKIPSRKMEMTQIVYVTFIIDSTGAISDVQVENPDKVHPMLAAEAVRVIREGPRWKPAIQNGKSVTYRHKQGIAWVAYKY